MKRLIAACSVLIFVISNSDADQITGNPAVDGWGLQGDSLAPGTFVRETASWDFNVYSVTYTLTSIDPLVNGTTWLMGDQILGMGGVMNGAQPIIPRLVAKFGATTNEFAVALTAATNLPPSLYNNNGTIYGDGVGELSSDGGLMVTYGYMSDYPSYALDPINQNCQIITPVPGNLYSYSATTGYGYAPLTNGDFGRVIANFQKDIFGQLVTQTNLSGQTSDMPILQSFEVLLNLSELNRAGYAQPPTTNCTGIMALQFKTDSFTDGFVSNFPNPSAPWLPQIQNVLVQTNQFGFDVTWASGTIIVVEACTNLADPIWSQLQTNALTGSCHFGDPQWTNYPTRFYRLRSQ